MPIVAILLALAAPAAASPKASPGQVPAKFQGEWVIDPAHCASRGGDNVEGAKITATDIVRYEEGVTIVRVTALSPDSIRYEGTLSTYDGDSPATGILELSPDGRRLKGAGYADGPDAQGPELQRCE
ncbi:hypothetical protein [Sphingosinicella sp. BN140058]|uniref:hypothetical protein n=1 Tax=Sphingosinicella sp. BN140058 TaxID=1892855 RepID=UPI0010123B43|nr:hypothetical protein [Sphingosinicella sp. BN140058]QAY78788.1 hypothetical protein ETR14_21295 [Sphingosinicella sp. BN140058]